jgi:hypothetical protein
VNFPTSAPRGRYGGRYVGRFPTYDSAHRLPPHLIPGGRTPTAKERRDPFLRRTKSPTVIERPLPQNVDAERSVLGAILLDNSTLGPAIEKLKPEDFFHDHHRRVFIGMIELGELQQAIDLVTLSDHLHRKGELEAAGGAACIAQLTDGVPHVSNLEHYARIIKEKAVLRNLIHATHAIQETALDGEDDAHAILDRASAAIAEISAGAAVSSPAGSLFDTLEEFENTPEATFSVAGFLQDYSVTAIAGLSGDGKTWVSLNIAAALLFGPGKLWDLFEVPDRAEKVIYFIPESSRSTFKTRLKLMGLYDEIDKRLFVRTLTKGRTVPLADPTILRAAKGAHIFCDTAVRFMKAVDENSASEAANGLSEDFFALQRAEAKSVTALFHSPKSVRKDDFMSLENMIRGSSEFGAVLASGWGIRQIDLDTNTVHVSNIKPRDFEPCADFQLIGRPYINQGKGFQLHRRPGECSKLSEYLSELRRRNRGGASAAVKQGKATNQELLREWLSAEPHLSSRALEERFAAQGITLGDSAIRRYRKELRL